jgi:UDP-glucuronate decarboxylase
MWVSDEVTGPVNAGNPGELTIRQLAETVIRLTTSWSKGEYRGRLRATIPCSGNRTSRLAREILQSKPSVRDEQGLVRTIDWFERLLKQGAYQAAIRKI